MKVFISWSGRRSKAVALVLRDWLPNVIQTLEPWMSKVDIDPGTRWNNDITAELSTTNVGILCVTRGNVNAPWLAFEAGALSKAVELSTRVIPYLIDLSKSEVPNDGPLPQFQGVIADKQGTRGMLGSINKGAATSKQPDHVLLDVKRLDDAFENWWPVLENKLTEIKNDKELDEEPQTEKPDPDALLNEIAEGIRILLRNNSSWPYLWNVPIRGLTSEPIRNPNFLIGSKPLIKPTAWDLFSEHRVVLPVADSSTNREPTEDELSMLYEALKKSDPDFRPESISNVRIVKNADGVEEFSYDEGSTG